MSNHVPVYLKLFHGRKLPDEDLNDWGSQGPILGPLEFVHLTYGWDIKLGQECPGTLVIGDDKLVYYDGVYYGDWSVFANLEPDMKPEPFDPGKAKRPDLFSQLSEELKALGDNLTFHTIPKIPPSPVPPGTRVTIPAAEVEFYTGRKAIWVHSPLGSTILRIQCDGEVTADRCPTSPTSHSDINVKGDIAICVSHDGNIELSANDNDQESS